MRIAVCDDEPLQLELICTYLMEWGKRQQDSLEVKKYISADSFLFDYEDCCRTDLLILDIEMPGMNGMDLAKKLRCKKDEIQIIFISGRTEYVYEGYFVDAVSYLLKPVKQELLFQCLEKAKNAIATAPPCLLAEENGILHKIRIDEILFIESLQHDTIIHTEKESIRNRQGISKAEDELAALGEQNLFYKIHRSYLVSIAKIKCITKKEVVMEDGTPLPLARGKWEDLNIAYLDYYRRITREGSLISL